VGIVAERPLTPTMRRLALASMAVLVLAVPAASVASTTASTPSVTRVQPGTSSGAGNVAAGAKAVSKAIAAKAAKAAKVAKAKAAARKRALKAAKVPLSGWLGDGSAFPDRALVLYAPPGVRLTPGRVHVTENGTAVGGLAVTPISGAQPGDFGVMLVVDQSPSMAGAPLHAAMAAARAIAAQRTAQQELGLVIFDSAPNVFLHLTRDQKSINRTLALVPWTGAGANVPAATKLALSQLADSKVALGAIVVISDGVGALTVPGGPTPAAVQAAVTSAHVPIITVGLRDQASSAATLSALQAASPGQFVPSTPARLPSLLKGIMSTLTRGYVVRYRSQQHPGRQVAVTAVADRVPGTVDASYQAPAVRVLTSSAPKASAAPGPRRSGPFSGTTLLSRWPSFAPDGSQSSATAALGSGPSTLLVAGICGLLIALAIALAVRRPPKGAVRTRVGNFIPGSESGEGAAVRDQLRRGAVIRLLERRKWWAPFVENVEVARSTHSPVELVKRAAAGGAILAVVVTLVSGSALLAILPLLGWPMALRMLIARRARKNRELFADTLPGYLQDLSSALRVGRSFASALAVVAASADEPVRGELERAVTDEALGRDLEESLEAVSLRMHATDMDQVALIAGLNQRSGSNVAEALDRVAEGARERADLRREIRALTAQGKMSSWILTALPPVMLLAISLVSPSYAHPLFHSTGGIVLLVIGAGMVLAGWKVMKKISTIKA
jgi:tight adherence protein B